MPTSRADFKKMYAELSPEGRREALDALDMTDVPAENEERWMEHDTLAEMVDEDESAALTAVEE